MYVSFDVAGDMHYETKLKTVVTHGGYYNNSSLSDHLGYIHRTASHRWSSAGSGHMFRTDSLSFFLSPHSVN